MGTRWPDHFFCQFEKRLPQPEIKCTRRIHLEIRFNLTLCFIRSSNLLQKTSFWTNFNSFFDIILSYLVKNSIQRNMNRRGEKRVGAGERNRLRLPKYQKKWINNIGEQIIVIFINLENRWKRLHMLGKPSFLDLEPSTMIHADHLCRWSNSEVFVDVSLSLEKFHRLILNGI